jgi:hypothetical protein
VKEPQGYVWECESCHGAGRFYTILGIPKVDLRPGATNLLHEQEDFIVTECSDCNGVGWWAP